jgi:hypothetical protein
MIYRTTMRSQCSARYPTDDVEMTTMYRKVTLSCWILLVCLCAVSCGGGNGNGGGDNGGGIQPIAARFTSSGTVPSPNTVRLNGSAMGNRVLLDVMIGGPTTSDDIYSFAFDIVLSNANVAQYQIGSVSCGSALTLGSGQQCEALASQQGNRVVIGVSKLGGGSGNRVSDPEETVVSLQLQVLQRAGTRLSIEGSLPNPPAVIDSAGFVIGTIRFDVADAMISGS